MIKIDPADLIPLDIFEDKEPIKIDLVYADAHHERNIFGEALYHNKARLWAHQDMAAITLLVSRILHKNYNWTLEIQDCLRTTDAQTKMGNTEIMKAHPEWCKPGPNRMVSPPGAGAHPRGMAIDVGPLDENGKKIDMGTPFDDMGEASARDYKDLPKETLNNRKILNNAFSQSATFLNLPLYMVPSEWWDFRFPAETYNQLMPLNDEDLPPQMQMTNRISNDIADFDNSHFERLADSILAMIEPHHGNL
jgi:D-alanyl-D-alanine dipeptidase